MSLQRIVFFMCCIAFSLAAQTVYVPAQHWVYDYLDRLETKRIIPVVLNGTQPMSRAEIAAHLTHIQSHVQKLSQTEQEQFYFLQTEFAAELDQTPDAASGYSSKLTRHRFLKSWLPDFVYANDRDFAAWQVGPLSVNANPILARRFLFARADSLNSTERDFQATNGVQLWGAMYQFGYFIDVRDTREWGTLQYPDGNTTAHGLGFVQGNGEQIYHDETVAYLTWRYKAIDVMFGKAENRWGPGYRGQLLLSNQATAYDQVKIQLGLPRLKFTFLTGWLKHYTPDYFFGDPIDKMLAAHRLEFSPWKWLDIGLQESIIYKGGSVRPAYANPVMFYRSAEHYLGDTDNAAMGTDFELKLIPGTKLYGELFLDDLTTSKIGTDYYGLKTAVQFGLFHVDLFGLPNLDARLEYTRIRPYVYSHKFDVTSYSHFDTGLGHPIGPNAESLYAELTWRSSRRLLCKANAEFRNYAENQDGINWGGDWRVPHLYGDPRDVPFLSGEVTRLQNYDAGVRYELLREMFVELKLRHAIWNVENSECLHRSEILFGWSWCY